jgi:hypothetical protein
MKKVIIILTALTFVTFNTIFAQYDILVKQGFYTADNSTAYGAPNKYDNQYERRDDRNADNYNYSNNPNTGRDREHYHSDNYNNREPRTNYYYNERTANRRSSLVIQDFDVDRYRKNEVEIEFEVRGPKFLTYKTQWRGTTLFVYFDYAYNRNDENKCNEVKIPIGRLSRNVAYNVVAIDLVSNNEIGRYSID